MINGIDLLFAVIALTLLFVVLEYGTRYYDWVRWDRDRRRGRLRARMIHDENFEEDEYRAYLRRLISNSLLASVHKTTRAFQRLNEVLRDS